MDSTANANIAGQTAMPQPQRRLAGGDGILPEPKALQVIDQYNQRFARLANIADSAKRLSNRVIYGAETMPESGDNQRGATPARSGLWGRFEDLGDGIDARLDELERALQELANHV